MLDLTPLTRAVLKLDPFADEISVAEAVWLATHQRSRAGPGRAPRATDQPAVAPNTATERSPERAKAEPIQMSVPLYAPVSDARTGRPARAVTIKPPPALPHSLRLAHSLRPFVRPWPGGPRTRLDVDATVRQYARTGQVVPHFQPRPEHWFEAFVLVDDAPGMAVWEAVIGQFIRVLRVAGAFRVVKRMSFDPGGKVIPELTGGPRRMVFVVSDCSAGPWQASAPWRALRLSAESQPTVLINLLPARMWDHAGLDLPAVRVFAEQTGPSNRALRFRLPLLCSPPGSESEDWIPIPVAGLTPHSLGRLAAALMRNDPSGCEAVLTTATGRSAADLDAVAQPDVEALVTAFRRMASPGALRLAVLVAMWERLPLRLLSVVAARAVPEATASDLGEVMASGLFLVDGDASSPMLTFRRDARETIQRDLRVDDVLRVYQLVSENDPADRGFRALVAEAAGSATLSSDAMAFGVLSPEAIDILGLHPPDRRVAPPDPPPSLMRPAPGRRSSPGSPTPPSLHAVEEPPAPPSRAAPQDWPVRRHPSGTPDAVPDISWPTIADIELEGWDGYDPSALSRERYDRIRSIDEQVIRIVADHFVRVAPQRWRERAVSIGDGVNLYPALLMLPFAGSVALVERSFVNREWLVNQLARPSDSWGLFWRAISEGRTEYARIRQPFDQLESRSEVWKGNVFTMQPMTYDIGTMFFVAEQATTRSDEFERATRLFIGSLRYRAPFAATFHRNSPAYMMGGRRLFACSVDVDDVRHALRDSFIEDITVVRDPDAEPGENEVIVAIGRGR
ncbi:SAV_2336 N-terminal domain-related protein [Actinoplanes sp. NPDC026619]|uniref:SAV_2336 N-terminal domain-related protein n=1 Tax=Actinoplanes sp. NPDC026619 TaxID=3155798 RepID=UPI0033CB1809